MNVKNRITPKEWKQQNADDGEKLRGRHGNTYILGDTNIPDPKRQAISQDQQHPSRMEGEDETGVEIDNRIGLGVHVHPIITSWNRDRQQNHGSQKIFSGRHKRSTGT